MTTFKEFLAVEVVKFEKAMYRAWQVGWETCNDFKIDEEPDKPPLHDTLADVIGIAPYDDHRAFGVDMGESKSVHRGWEYTGKNGLCNAARLNERNIIRLVCNQMFDKYGDTIKILEGSTVNRFGCRGHGDAVSNLAHSNLKAVDFEYIWLRECDYYFYSTLHRYMPKMTVRMWTDYKARLEIYAGKKLPWIKGDDRPARYNHDTHGHVESNAMSNEDYGWDETVGITV